MRKFMNMAWLGTGLLAVFVAFASMGCPGNWATLRVWNNTGKTIEAVFCTPTTDDSWGPNLISSDILPGETRDIPRFQPDNYDILAVFSDDTEAEEDDVTFVAGETFTWNVLLSLPSGKAEPGPVSEDAAEVRMKSSR